MAVCGEFISKLLAKILQLGSGSTYIDVLQNLKLNLEIWLVVVRICQVETRQIDTMIIEPIQKIDV